MASSYSMTSFGRLRGCGRAASGVISEMSLRSIPCGSISNIVFQRTNLTNLILFTPSYITTLRTERQFGRTRCSSAYSNLPPLLCHQLEHRVLRRRYQGSENVRLHQRIRDIHSLSRASHLLSTVWLVPSLYLFLLLENALSLLIALMKRQPNPDSDKQDSMSLNPRVPMFLTINVTEFS